MDKKDKAKQPPRFSPGAAKFYAQHDRMRPQGPKPKAPAPSFSRTSEGELQKKRRHTKAAKR